MAKAKINILPWLTLREALKRVRFEVLRPYLHTGRIPARYRRMYTSGGEERSGPGDIPPTLWASAYKDPDGRVLFTIEWVENGRVIQETIFAYPIDIELDPAAFETFFPAAAGPAESDGMRAVQESILEQNTETASSASAASSPAADAPAPVVNTEAPAAEPEVASSSLVDAMTAEQPGESTVGVQASVHAQNAPEQSELSPSKSPEPGRGEPTEQLTYAQIVDRLGCPSEEAARDLVRQRRLPRARGSDGKILVTINLQEIHYRPQSARSPGSHRPMTGQSPGDSTSAASSPTAPQTKPESPAPKNTPTPTPPTTAKDWFRKACEAYPRLPDEETGDYAKRLEEEMPQSKAGVKKPWEQRGIIRRLQEQRKAEAEAKAKAKAEAAAQKARRPPGER